MKKLSFLFVLAVCACALYGKNPKYVFLFIGDGMATPQRMVADEFSRKMGRGQLAINTLPYHATTRTSCVNSLVTDSAAAATAIACGEKTRSGRIGMDASGERKLESVAYVARRGGKKVGIVTSVTINHATPAGFYAHRRSRAQYYAIGLDLIGSGFDYFGGGGVAKHDDKTAPEYKGDIYELAAKAGYKVVRDKAGLLALTPADGKVLASGASGKLPYSIDGRKDVATLAEYTAKGIELLDNPKGFFMMVEGGAIDWCGHANEAAGNLHEVLALDEAVRVALKFAEKHPDETLIIVTGDHETGGMTMGFAGTGYAIYMERLTNQKCSHEAFAETVKAASKGRSDFSFEDAKKLLAENFGFKFTGDPKKDPMVINDKELKILQDGFKKNKLPNAARLVMAGKAGIGWTSGSHTALPVLTTSKGAGAELFSGFIDNTDIAKKLKTLL
ncbi:MAG: alkaline phosphatase [Lentisphaeria bacterium]|nr:alkaline phosphatase [Lentisphaeria bacterium]